MSVIIKNLIEYEGINSINITCKNNAFKQIILAKKSDIPINKPDILKITKLNVETDIIDSYLVKTPIGKSIEGVSLTGVKLFISGNIKMKIQYLTKERDNLVKSFFYETAYSGLVVLPKGTKEKTYIVPGVFIEDAFIKATSQRSFYTSISLILTASIC